VFYFSLVSSTTRSKNPLVDGKNQSFNEEDILNKEEKKSFEDDWTKKWAPKVKDSELFSIGGVPADEMNHI